MYVSHAMLIIIMKFVVTVKVNMKKRDVNLWRDMKIEEMFL